MQQLTEIIKTNIKRLAITTFGTYYIYNSHFLRDAQERMHFYLQITLLGRERQWLIQVRFMIAKACSSQTSTPSTMPHWLLYECAWCISQNIKIGRQTREKWQVFLFLFLFTSWIHFLPPLFSLLLCLYTQFFHLSSSFPRLPIISALNQFVLNNHHCPWHSPLYFCLSSAYSEADFVVPSL